MNSFENNFNDTDMRGGHTRPSLAFKSNVGTESGGADVSKTDPTSGQEFHDTDDRHTGMEGSGDRTLIGDTHSKRFNDATGFISEGAVEVREMDESPEEDEMMRNLHPASEQHHTIERILSRPVKIASLRYDSTQNIGSIIGSFDVLTTFKQSSAFRLAREKLSAFYGVKWTAHLKVTVNAQPFETGIFQIFFLPFYLISDQVIDPNDETNTEGMLPFTTGCPQIFCNIAQQSEIELAVPYTGPAAFINLTNNLADYGTYFIQAVTPIADATNAPSCELSVYMYFSDIQFFGTSPNNVVSPQMFKQPSEREEAGMKESGPLTKVANTLLPILNMLGLSAPGANPNPKRFTINPYAMNSTVDTTKVAQKVSYTFDHHLTLGKLGVDNVDEMAVKTIISKPTYYNQFPWTTQNDFGTILAAYPVEPSGVLTSNLPDGQTGQLLAPTRLRYVGNAFKYWRGSIKYHFNISANKFHSGRLRFVYVLGGPSSPQADYQNILPRSFTQIIDIRDATHFEICVPYFSSAPWRTVPQVWNAEAGTYTGGGEIGPLDDLPGFLYVYVENELRASPTTTQSVQIVCCVSAGDDFEYAVPIAPTLFPHIRSQANRDTFVTPQGYDYEPINMVSGQDKMPGNKSKPHKFTVGEDVKSVRALIKRYQLIATANLNFSDQAPKNYCILPYYFQQPNTPQTYMYDMLSYFRPLYKFYRGSIRHMITTPTPNTQFTVRFDPELLDPIASTTSDFGTRSGYLNVTDFGDGGGFSDRALVATVPYFSPLQGGMEVEFPYYSRFHKLFMSYDDATTDPFTTYFLDVADDLVPAGVGYMQITSTDASATARPFNFYRAAADDFSMGYLLGAPFVRANVVRQNS